MVTSIVVARVVAGVVAVCRNAGEKQRHGFDGEHLAAQHGVAHSPGPRRLCSWCVPEIRGWLRRSAAARFGSWKFYFSMGRDGNHVNGLGKRIVCVRRRDKPHPARTVAANSEQMKVTAIHSSSFSANFSRVLRLAGGDRPRQPKTTTLPRTGRIQTRRRQFAARFSPAEEMLSGAASSAVMLKPADAQLMASAALSAVTSSCPQAVMVIP